MITEKHPTKNYTFRLFSTKEKAIESAKLCKKDRGYDEKPVAVLSGWVLVNENRTKDIRDEWGMIMNMDIIKELESLYYESLS
jgi:hypothetical protein